MPSRADVDILHALYQELARKRFGDATKWARISPGTRVSTIFSGGAGAVAGFARVLNAVDPIKKDGVKVHPGDLREAKTAWNMYTGMISAYKKAGFTVTS